MQVQYKYESMTELKGETEILPRPLREICKVILIGGAGGKEPAHQSRRYKRRWFSLWVGKIPWWRAQQHTPVFLPRESHGAEKPGGLYSIGSLIV